VCQEKLVQHYPNQRFQLAFDFWASENPHHQGSPEQSNINININLNTSNNEINK